MAFWIRKMEIFWTKNWLTLCHYLPNNFHWITAKKKCFPNSLIGACPWNQIREFNWPHKTPKENHAQYTCNFIMRKAFLYWKMNVTTHKKDSFTIYEFFCIYSMAKCLCRYNIGDRCKKKLFKMSSRHSKTDRHLSLVSKWLF